MSTDYMQTGAVEVCVDKVHGHIHLPCVRSGSETETGSGDGFAAAGTGKGSAKAYQACQGRKLLLSSVGRVKV